MDKIANPSVVHKLVIVQCLGGAFLGYAFCSFNPCQDALAFFNNWEKEEERNFYFGILSSILIVGAMVSSSLSSTLLKKSAGHRDLTTKADIVSLIASLLLLYSHKFPYQFFGKLFSGFGFGISSCLIPNYINQISPKEIYGQMGSWNQFSVCLGIFATFLIGMVMPNQTQITAQYNDQVTWRIVVGIQLLFPLIRIIMTQSQFPYNVELPQELILQKKQDQLKLFLKEIYSNEAQQQVFEEMIQQYQPNEPINNKNQQKQNDGLQLSNPIYLYCLKLGIAIVASQHFSAINVVMQYSNTIFVKAGQGEYAGIYTVIIGLMLILGCLVTGALINKYDRKTYFLNVHVILIIQLFVIGYAIQINQAIIGVYTIFIFIGTYNLTLGPIPGIYLGEIINQNGISLCITIAWIIAILISFFFPFMAQNLGLSISFYVFVFLSICCFIYLKFYMIETRNLTKEQIRQNVMIQLNKTIPDTENNAKYYEMTDKQQYH